MSNRYKGAVISATPPSVSRGPGAAFASGIWTPSQQAVYQAAGTWPLSYDPNFNQTVLLLHGDGTNGAQNNTFLDSSTNNFTITRNGNTTQGTFSPFSLPNGEWSNYFDGSGDYLSFANNAALNPGTDDFVMECWVYLPVATGVNQGFNGKGTPATDGYTLFVDGSLVLTFIWNGAGGATITAGTLSLNTWHHVAVVRNSSVIRLYLDGVGAASSTACTTNITSTATKYVGQARGGSEMTGYLSNYRMVKGALPSGYDATSSSLTPPTAPLTAISGTSLLTCQSNRFVDNSTNNFAITVNGNTSVQPFSPFAPSAAYSPSVNGGSGYFDGSGDTVTAPSDADFELTADYTISFWFNTGSLSGARGVIANNATLFGTGTTNSFAAILNHGTAVNKLSIWADNINNAAFFLVTSSTLTTNQWYFVTISRSSGVHRLFLNGVEEDTDTNSSTLFLNTNGAFKVGAYWGGDFNGYISDVQVKKGVGVTSVTVPSTPLTSDANTSLLLNFTNAGIFDNTSKNNLETVGNAQIDTTTKKWGTGSLEFDGTGDYLTLPASLNLDLSTGNFTVECWFYYATTPPSGSGYDYLWGFGGNNTNGLGLYIQGGVPKIWNGSSILTNTGSIAATTWYHIAVVRSNGTLTVYLNGTSIGSVSLTNNISGGGSVGFSIAKWVGASDPEDFNGYIDDLRITKGVARYTANFTPPNGPFFNT